MYNMPSPAQVRFDELRVYLVPRQAGRRPEDRAVDGLSLPPGHLRQVLEPVVPDCGGSYVAFRLDMPVHV